MEIKDITPEIVDAVEAKCGMGHPAWDTIDPREIILAAYTVVENTIGSPPLPKDRKD